MLRTNLMERKQETLGALQDFIPVRRIMAELILHTQFVTFTLMRFVSTRAGRVCRHYADVVRVYSCVSVSVFFFFQQQSWDLRAKIGEVRWEKEFSLGAEVSDEGFVNLLRGAHLCQVVTLSELVTNLYHMLSPACEVTMRFHYGTSPSVQWVVLSLRKRDSSCPGNIQNWGTNWGSFSPQKLFYYEPKPFPHKPFPPHAVYWILICVYFLIQTQLMHLYWEKNSFYNNFLGLETVVDLWL